ncbi:hypothetical protein [Streptomyces sp. NPDC059491]|uniref:hypothetical protein n=1 Tax=Streptomyces sp. NPDC059491 TaxID=3346850 RepID=UPI0036CFD6E0
MFVPMAGRPLAGLLQERGGGLGSQERGGGPGLRGQGAGRRTEVRGTVAAAANSMAS